ncbi:MAG: hypothetical protein ACKVS5_06405 [Parvularculaceae bacterium]
MSKLNVGVGEDFPLNDAPKNDGHPCAHWRARRMHYRRHRHHGGPIAALFVLPAAAASVTAAILYPLATLAVLGGLGTAGAIYRHTRGDKNAKPEQK